MIHTPLITFAGFAAALGLLLSSTSAPAQDAAAPEKTEPATPRDEATALKEFKASMGGIKQWMQVQQKAAAQNPLAGLEMLKEMSGKVGKVSTDGLPEDLKKEFVAFQDLLRQMAGVFKDMPKDEDEKLTWLKKKGADPEFRTKMELIGKELTKTSSQLREAGKKHGIEAELDLESKGEGKEDSNEDPVVEEK